MVAANTPRPFWLISSPPAARICLSPGHHVITAVDEHGSFDADGPDDEELAHGIAGALFYGDVPPAGYQGTETLEQARAEADKAWDAKADCAGCGETVGSASELSESGLCSVCWVAAAPQWLGVLRSAGAL